jgi:hypothetical protein
MYVKILRIWSFGGILQVGVKLRIYKEGGILVHVWLTGY